MLANSARLQIKIETKLLTLTVLLATIRNHAGLAVVERLPRGRRSRLAVLRTVASEALRRDMRLRLRGLRRLWHGTANAEVAEARHEHAIGIEWLPPVVRHATRHSSSIVRTILDSAQRRRGRHDRGLGLLVRSLERGSLGMQGRQGGRDGGITSSNVMTVGHADITRHVLAVAIHGTGREASQAGIVVVEMLLSMDIGIGTQSRAIGLDGRDVVGRVRLLKLGGRGHGVGGRRGNNRGRSVQGRGDALGHKLHAIH